MIIDFLSNLPPAKASPIDIARREGDEFAAFLLAMTDAQPMPGESQDHASGGSDRDVEAHGESTVPPDPDDAGPDVSGSGDAGAPDHEGRETRADTEPAHSARQPEPGAAIPPSSQRRIGGEAGAAEPPVSAPSTLRARLESPAPTPQTAVAFETEHPMPRHPADVAAPGHGAPRPAGGDFVGGRVTADLPLTAQGGQGQDTRGTRAPIALPLPAPTASPQGANPAAPRKTNMDSPAPWTTGSGAMSAILQGPGQSAILPATSPARDPVRGPMSAAHDAPDVTQTSPNRAGFNAVRSAEPAASTPGMPPPTRFAGTEAPIPGAHPHRTMPEPASTATPVSITRPLSAIPPTIGGVATAPTRPPLTIEPFTALQGTDEPRPGHADRGDGRTVLHSAETPLPGGPAAAPATQADATMRNATDVARHTAQQIAARAVDLGHGRFELSLSPAELGKVDMLLQDGENRLTLFINAERPETMDLIRRHISLLEQELRQMGLGTLSLQLGNDGSGQSGPRHGSDPWRGTQGAAPVPALPPECTPPRIAGDHLDLRM